jgi:hypothetical protein
MISKESILVILGSPIAYYTAFARAFGSVEAGIFTSQFFYWYGKGQNPEGWIYKTQEEIEQETGLTRRNQETARKRLRALGVLEEKRMGAPSRLFYRLNLDHLFGLVNEWTATGALPEVQTQPSYDGGSRHRRMADPAIVECTDPPSYDGGIRQSRMRESANLECTDPPDKNGGSRHSLYITKNTSQTTSKNTIIIIGEEDNPPNHDDDDAVASLPEKNHGALAMLKIMRTLAKEIIHDMGRGVWNGRETFVDGCTETELQNLLTWLWLWDITDGPAGNNPAAQWERKTYYHQPFDGVRSIPGKIITQVRKGHAADLNADDQAELQHCLAERAAELTQDG